MKRLLRLDQYTLVIDTIFTRILTVDLTQPL